MSEHHIYDLKGQGKLVLALFANLHRQARQGRVQLLETHISWVLLAGPYAYKIKKALSLGFLDYGSLAQRLFYCNEEIRLNRRLAPEIYLEVLAIGGSAANPELAALPAIEYAVKMRRFPVSRQLDRLAVRGKLLPQHIDSLAKTLANFHRELPIAHESTVFGTAESIAQDARQNFEQLQTLLPKAVDLHRLARLRHANEGEYAACSALLRQRAAHGFIREGHGDLHLGNIVLLDERPVPFDGIEFNPALRWIDVISDIAFTVMDLLHYRRADLAWRLLNAWLEITGDYEGIRLLRFYTAYRAMVRAKVNALRATQTGLPPRAASVAWSACRRYMRVAEQCLAQRAPALIITHGLPGSGKSTLAQAALQRFQAIRLRSDVERKRLYRLAPLADSHNLSGVDLYSAEATQRTYARLAELARVLLQAGYPVIVDAAFITINERALFQRLARELSVPFAIAAVSASRETLRARILQRQRAANDPSEADTAVMEKLALEHDALTPTEREFAVEFCNEGEGVVADEAAWSRLGELFG